MAEHQPKRTIVATADRREFLQRGGAFGGQLLLAGPLQAFLAQPAYASDAGYGAIAPVKDNRTGMELLALPQGFQYWSFGEQGSPMSDGRPTPPRHDGMAAFQHGGKIHLVRNHEVRGSGKAFGPTDRAYDERAPGGTTTVVFDPQRPLDVTSFASLSGTSTNCAGGPTPRQSWLTCEETVEVFGQPHGFVFEVSSDATGAVDARPLKSLGRFVHEAVAVDPVAWILYLTEDAGQASGIYRFVPHTPGNLDWGRLQMLAVKDKPEVNLFVNQVVGVPLPIVWVDIDVPSPDPITETTSVFAQGRRKGGAAFSRLEGAWFSDTDGAIYFNATDGGNVRAGQVWALRPGRATGTARPNDTLTLIYESPSASTLLKPDNITVSPSGGILLCEDPDRARQAYMRGLTREGTLYDFARNIRPGVFPGGTVPHSFDEFAGATFNSDGQWLFVNIQTPGISFAITGPFEKGPLGGNRAR